MDLFTSVHYLDGLVFERTNLDLYHPAVSGETVNIDCRTDDKNAQLQLVKKDQKTGDETILVVRLFLRDHPQNTTNL